MAFTQVFFTAAGYFTTALRFCLFDGFSLLHILTGAVVIESVMKGLGWIRHE